jgi:hypothetical protein
MAARIPDLWKLREDAPRLYRFYLTYLMRSASDQRVVSACRQIRRYASRGPGREEGQFTFWYEIDALINLKNYQGAWRQLRLSEEIATGQRLDLTRRQLSTEEAMWIPFQHAPILYFLGRYRQGCSLLESALDVSFQTERVKSFDLLFRIYNDEEEPTGRSRVTLTHFYRRMKLCIRDWSNWDSFVRGFPPRLFRLAGVHREELRVEPERLAIFFTKLMEVRAERTTSGFTRGQADLIESPRKVRKWQDATLRKHAQFIERTKSTRERTDAKLLELFPELERLPQ